MVKSSPSKICKVEKTTSSSSTGGSSQEPDSSQGCVDVAWEDDETVIKEEAPGDGFVFPGADPEYDEFVANTFIVKKLADVEKRTFPGKNGKMETEDVCNLYVVDPLGVQRVFVIWKEKARQMHDYIT